MAQSLKFVEHDTGQTGTSRADVNAAQAEQMILGNWWVTSQDYSLHWNCLSEVHWAPRHLMETQKLTFWDCCFSSSLVSGRRKRIPGIHSDRWGDIGAPFHSLKQARMQWKHVHPWGPEKWVCQSAGKVMVSVVWDAKGVIHVEFVSQQSFSETPNVTIAWGYSEEEICHKVQAFSATILSHTSGMSSCFAGNFWINYSCLSAIELHLLGFRNTWEVVTS